MNPRSFRTRLLFLTILVLVPTGFLVLVANVQRMRTEKEKIRQQAVFAAKLAAASQLYYVKEARQLLATVTQFQFLALSTNRAYCEKQFSNLKLLSPDFNDFGLIELDGSVFCSSLDAKSGAEPVSAAFATRALRNPGFAMGDLRRDLKPGSLQFAYPVFDTERHLARLMYASLKLPLLSAALAGIPLPENGVLSVVDRAGNIVALHPQADGSIGKPLPSFPLIQNALAKSTEVFEFAPAGREEKVYAVSAVREGSTPLLYIQVAAPRKTLFAQTDARFGASLAGLFLIASLVLSLAWFFSEQALLRPVRTMLRATERLITGDLTARTGVTKPRNELHILAARFDVMAETLAQRQTELEFANREIRKINAELEQRVQKRTEDLQILNKELEAFSYSVSHDLRAPLRHMESFAQILADDPSLQSNETAQGHLRMISNAARQMATLIDDLLAFSKMARQSMVLQTVNSDGMVKAIVDEMTAAESGREILWTIGALPSVQGDSAMLRQVWLNLIGNAVKYTKHKKPAKIEISGFTEGNETVFAVADNGAGFDMAYAHKLFGVFQRLHREDEFPGTGIGLANVRRIVERHGGRTWAKSAPGKGATFYFSLPAISPGARDGA